MITGGIIRHSAERDDLAGDLQPPGVARERLAGRREIDRAAHHQITGDQLTLRGLVVDERAVSALHLVRRDPRDLAQPQLIIDHVGVQARLAIAHRGEARVGGRPRLDEQRDQRRAGDLAELDQLTWREAEVERCERVEGAGLVGHHHAAHHLLRRERAAQRGDPDLRPSDLALELGRCILDRGGRLRRLIARQRIAGERERQHHAADRERGCPRPNQTSTHWQIVRRTGRVVNRRLIGPLQHCFAVERPRGMIGPCCWPSITSTTASACELGARA
ncbi:MAG: hypothetical protein WKG01_12275 [Kofleriaceae bacterium]